MSLKQQTIAIIGSGPSGFYAAERLIKKAPEIAIHMYESLPTPFGLLRGGVAPDHQKMKSISSAYDRIASAEQFSFFGNVTVGKDLTVSQLQESYDALIFACGANCDKSLGLAGEALPGVYSATDFVGWYNAHPDFIEKDFELDAKKVAIVGQGNVAVDVMRVLAKTKSELQETDISIKALERLDQTAIEHIYMIGRRGPIQAAFTDLELKGLNELECADLYVNEAYLNLSETDLKELETSNKARKNLEILKQCSVKPSGKKPIIELMFFRSPVEILGDNRVAGLKLEKNTLIGEPGSQKAQASGEYESLDVQLIFKSIGYKARPIEGVPFDDKRGVIPNEKGRVIDAGEPLQGMYVTGWIKRGPSGVIGTNRKDSFETVDALLEDLKERAVKKTAEPQTCLEFLEQMGQRVVSYEDWLKLDAEEKRQGEALGKVRKKFSTVDEMLHFLDSQIVFKG